MAIVKIRYNKYYIQWYDAQLKKVQSRSTGLDVSAKNEKLANKYAKELQEELSRQNRQAKESGFNTVTIRQAYDHMLKNNQNKSAKTIKDYERFYKKFTECFDENQQCVTINKINVEEWLNQIKQLPFALNTIHGYGKQLIHFLNFLFEYNYTPVFKINREVRTKPEIKEKIIFSDEDIKKIFNGLKSKNSNFETTIYLLFYTGLRSSDILNINKGRIDLKNRILYYYSPKRKKHREIAFHSELVPVLKSRIKNLKTMQLLDYKNVESLGRAIKRYMKDLKIETKGYTARTFRKTFISLCRSRYDMDASIVRELVGHEHGNTTDRYYNQISIKKMKDELKKFKKPK